MPQFKTLRYEVADHILTLTMNRPERLNAFNSEMQGEFLKALDHADVDDEIRVVIVTGEGRGFCCLLYTSPSPRDLSTSRMPSSA